ncbi:hypothetical protein A2Y85_03290 [candidate division WOR-3 bacterium RBG_13_43_14]|uniref:Capsule synthesis protein CapA domain-containing protein n=1 Tax=candidate division WOR-3 bacterium RBG_13_43_14 TaxID=1802590 RepID=A0A1F4UEA6_UNCW3|nr:MAG: hypothetical protein A2Y85_03290 [candidate division WOR-3 bacterium RBG_13_43_14]
MILIFTLFFIGQSPAQQSVRFCAVGDILLDRGIRRSIEQNTLNYPFEQIADFINAHDLAFCNLECPISAIGYSTSKIYCFRADTNFFTGLTNAGFNIFCLANNHVIDWGPAACLDTRNLIENKGLYAVGAGEDQSIAISPTIISCNGLKFAFIASVGAPLKEVIWPLLKPGPAQASLDTIIDRIRMVRDSVDFVIVSMHWGTEYVHVPDKWQIEWAHEIIDAGADLLIGHHPHVLQSVELYGNKLIAYSLGNFIFDQRKLYQRQSTVLSIVFNKGSIDSISLRPVLIDNFQPALASDTMFDKISGLINKISLNNFRHQILEDRILCLNESNGSVFPVPILRTYSIPYDISIYQDRITIVDNANLLSKTHLIENGTIADAEIFTEPVLKIFAIVRSQNAVYADKIAHYQLQNGSIAEVDLKYTDDRPWKIEKGDIDGDSKPELCLAVNKMAKFSKKRNNRLQIFSCDGQRLEPLWFSSANEIEFYDMMIRDVQNDGLADLLVLNQQDNNREILLYQWIGSRFVLDHVLMTNVQTDWIEDAFFQYSATK